VDPVIRAMAVRLNGWRFDAALFERFRSMLAAFPNEADESEDVELDEERYAEDR
jgi:hypothetical protein